MRGLKCLDSKGQSRRSGLIFASGTPMVNSPADINELVRTMEGNEPNWANDRNLSHCSWGALESLTKDIDGLMRAHKSSVDAVKNAVGDKESEFYTAIQKQKEVMQSLVVRRQEDSRG